MENELSQYGDTPYFARGWGRIMPWTMRADDSWDVFNVSTADLCLVYQLPLILNVLLHVDLINAVYLTAVSQSLSSKRDITLYE